MALIKSFYKILRVFPDPDYFYIQNEYNGSSTFTLNKTGTPATTDLEYSKDKSTWTAFDLTKSTDVSLNSGEKLYLRSTTGFSADGSNFLRLYCSQNYSVGGHISSLINYQNIDSITAIPDCGFYQLFSSSSKIISVSNLDFSGITSVGSHGFYQMFYNCSALTTGPDLSSLTSVGGYGMYQMFYNCSSLTTAPDLSSVTSVDSSGIKQMFFNCSSLNLVTAPNVSSWNTSNTSNWLNGVASTGVVRKPSGLTIPTGTNGVPTGWTTVDY